MIANENNITINRAKERWGFAILFVLGAFCSIVLFWSLALDIYNSKPLLLNTFIIFFLILVFVPYTIYNYKMTFGNRFIFEINDSGIRLKDENIYKWESIYEIEINKYPKQGLRTIYYLIGPRGIYFYSIIIYHDLLLKSKTKISFSSDTNVSFDQIEDAIIDYSVKHNITIR